MNTCFDLTHDRLAAATGDREISRALDALGPIDSHGAFNGYCREACRCWQSKFPAGRGKTTAHFDELLSLIAQGGEGVSATGWGGVVVTRHQHPHVEKYLVVRRNGYLALEKHEQKDERLEVREGAGLLLWRRPNEQRLSLEPLHPGAEFHFVPGQEHCLIGAEHLLVLERSIDPKGMDQDLIFLFEPELISDRSDA